MTKIYLIHADPENIYKIGVSKTVKKRLKTLQTANSNKLSIVKTFQTKHNRKVETALHKYFRKNKVRGEWFKLSTQQVARFEERCRLYEQNFDILKEHQNPFV